MSSMADARPDAPEFSDFALMACSGVLEGLDAAGIDGRLSDAHRPGVPPASADDGIA